MAEKVSGMVQRVSLQVTGMSCTGCEQRLGRALGRMQGVSEAKADYRTGLVDVRFDPAVTDTAGLAERVHEVGYEVVGAADGTTP